MTQLLSKTAAEALGYYSCSHLSRVTRLKPSRFYELNKNHKLPGMTVQDGTSTVEVFSLFHVLEFIHHNPKTPVKLIQISNLLTHSDLQYRTSGDAEYETKLNSAVAQNAILPPVVAFEHTGTLYLAEGHRRLQAYKNAGKETIQVIILPGGLEAAREYAFRINETNGQCLNKGATKAVLRYLQRNPTLQKLLCEGTLSHREISKLLGFSESSVYRAKTRLISAEAGAKPRNPKAQNIEAIPELLTSTTTLARLCSSFEPGSILTQNDIKTLAKTFEDLRVALAQTLNTKPAQLSKAIKSYMNN